MLWFYTLLYGHNMTVKVPRLSDHTGNTLERTVSSLVLTGSLEDGPRL